MQREKCLLPFPAWFSESEHLPHLHTWVTLLTVGCRAGLGHVACHPSYQSMSGHVTGRRLEVKDFWKECGLGLELWL